MIGKICFTFNINVIILNKTFRNVGHIILNYMFYIQVNL